MNSIQELIDLQKFKYVCPFDMTIKTSRGNKTIKRGFLSDGASGVSDLNEESFFFHDTMYLYPVLDNGLRVSRFFIDFAYGRILFKYGNIFPGGLIRPVALSLINTLPHSPWQHHRQRETFFGPTYVDYIQTRYHIPQPANWSFPSIWLKDAIYQGS